MKITRIDPMSFAKISGFTYAFMGLIAGILYFLFFLVLGMTGAGSRGGIMGMMIGLAAVIFIPIFYGIFGFVFGLIFAALFNLATKYLGGLEIQATIDNYAGGYAPPVYPQQQPPQFPQQPQG